MDAFPDEASSARRDSLGVPGLSESPNYTLRGRDRRLVNVEFRRQSRTFTHIQSFMRLCVMVSNDKNDKNSKPFSIVVNCGNTIEQVAHQIEAEYAFNHNIYSHRHYIQYQQHRTNDAPINAADDTTEAIGVLQVDPVFIPLSCGMIHDSNNMELRFDDIVGNILQFDETIYITNTWHAPVISNTVSRSVRANSMSPISASPLPPAIAGGRSASAPGSTSLHLRKLSEDDDTVTLRPSVAPLIQVSEHKRVSHSLLPVVLDTESNLPDQSNIEPNLFPQDSASSKNNKPSFTRKVSQASSIMSSHSKMEDEERRASPQDTSSNLSSPTSQLPIEIDNKLEALLYSHMGLDLFREFCTLEFSLEPLLFWMDCEVFQTTSDEMMRRELAKFIYLTYIKRNAPLLVNLALEVKRELQWDVINDVNKPLDISLFDEAQEDAYCMLRGYQYPRFESSPFMQSYISKREQDQPIKESSYAMAFVPDIDFIKLVNRILEAPESATSVEALRKLSKGRNDVTVSSTSFKEIILGHIISNYFVQVKSNPAIAYFSDSARLTWGLKQRKLAKADKLSKFFGHRLSASDLKKQDVARVFSSHSDLLGSLDSFGSQSSLNLRHRKGGSSSHNDGLKRRKRAGKLESVFGERLPKKHLKIQNLVEPSVASSSSLNFDDAYPGARDEWEDVIEPMPTDTELVPLQTINNLTIQQRRHLAQRSAKLKKLMGQALKEQEVASQLSLPEHLTRNASNVHRDSSSSVGSSPHSVDSGTSPSSKLIHSFFPPEVSERDVQRKRLVKLADVFGEPITQHELLQASSGSSSYMTGSSTSSDERRDHSKLTAKLGRILGSTAKTSVADSGNPVAKNDEDTKHGKSAAKNDDDTKHGKSVAKNDEDTKHSK